MVWCPQASHFPTKIQSKNHAFSETPSWTSFLRLLRRPGAKMMDFGSPLAPSWAQNGSPEGLHRAKNASNMVLTGGGCPEAREPFWTLRGLIFELIWASQGAHFRALWALPGEPQVARSAQRGSHEELTTRSENRQIAKPVARGKGQGKDEDKGKEEKATNKPLRTQRPGGLRGAP